MMLQWTKGTETFVNDAHSKAILIEEGTTNLIPVEKQKFEGWLARDGAVVALTQNQVVPEWGALDATRIQISGGTTVDKYRLPVTVSSSATSWSIHVKNNGVATVGISVDTGMFSGEKRVQYVQPNEAKRLTWEYAGSESHYETLLFVTENAGDSIDCIAWHPQIEAKPYCTSFTPTTRQREALTLPASVLNEAEGEISVWAYEDGVARDAYLWDTNVTSTRCFFAKSLSGNYNLRINGETVLSVVKSAVGMHLYKFVWNNLYAAFFIDGVRKWESTLSKTVTFADSTLMYLGSSNGPAFQWNAPIDNLVIKSKTQATPEAIAVQAALEYTQGQVLPDANTTYCQDFDGSLAAICPFQKKITANVGNYIDDNGDVHVLVRSRYPSDGIKPAAVYTDYVDQKLKLAYVQNPKVTRMGPTLLQDPSFEQGGKWGSYDNLYRKYGDAKDGSYYMRNSYTWNVSQTVTVQAGKTYVLSVFCRKSTGIGNSCLPRIVLGWHSSQGSISSVEMLGKDNGSWEQVATKATAPAGSQLVIIYLLTNGGSNDINTNASDFDCIYFGEVESLDSPVPGYSDDPRQEIQITTELAAGDVLKLDSAKFDAHKNGASIINNVSTSFLVHGLKIKPGRSVLLLEDSLAGKGLYKMRAKFQPKYY